MQSSEIDTLFVPIACACCGHATTVTIAWLKANALFSCRSCGSSAPYDRTSYLEAVGAIANATCSS